MNWSFKKMALILLVLCMAFGLAADNSVFIGDGDVGSLKLYDRDGRPIDAALAEAGDIGEGWIIHNPESDILIVTPVGTVNLYQDSLAITTSLRERDIEITLVRGKGTFNATGLTGGSLTVSTPASRYTLHDEGELYVVTSDSEESVTVFSGSVASYNLITGQSSTIDNFEKLYMQDMSRTGEKIQRGYFLTYATYPAVPAAAPAPPVAPALPPVAKAEAAVVPALPVVEPPLVMEPPKVAEPMVAHVAEVPPPAPPVAAIEPVKPEPVPEAPGVPAVVAEPMVEEVAPVPVTPVPSFLTVFSEALVEEPEAELPVTPPAPSFITVMSRALVEEPEAAVEELPLLPAAPSFIAVKSEAMFVEPEAVVEELPLLPAAPSFIAVKSEAMFVEPEAVVEELPLTPAAPSFITVKREAMVAEPAPVAAEPTILIPPIPTMARPTVTLEKVAVPVAPPAPTPVARPALASSAEQEKRSGSFGVEAGYEFTLDGTDSNTMNHRLSVKPYISKGPFAIRLNAFIETEQFTDLSNSVIPLPTGTLNLIDYLFTFVDHLRIGYETGSFYLVADPARSMGNELSTFFAPNFGESDRLVFQSKISIGAFTIQAAIDDLRLASMRGGERQFSQMMVSFTNPKGYPVTVALGALAEGKKAYTVNLYPLLSFKLPIINSRTTQFSALIQAQGYLPAYPSFDFDQFVDTSLPSFFPNYLLAGGFSLARGSFSARILAALNEGKNHNLLVNDFTYSDIDTSYDSDFDVLAELAWSGKSISAHLTMNLPLTSSFTFATLTGGHGADFTQLSLAVDISDVTVTLGLQQLGIIDTVTDLLKGDVAFLDLLGGPYAASYLSVGYTWAPFTFQAKASYPARTGSFTVPIISVSAKVDLNKRF